MQVKLSPTTLEQRHPLYADVEALIDYGFLTEPVVINGFSLSLRSLNPGDQFLLRQRVHQMEGDEWRNWVIASSIWMVNGHNLLGETQATPSIVKAIRHLPKNVRNILFNVVLSLFQRLETALEDVEAFACESISRYKWKSLGGKSPAEHSGFQGIGTNHVQRVWTFYNVMDDVKQADDSMWEGFKLTASATSPKGVKKIDEKDKQTRQNEKDRRQIVVDKFFYVHKGVMKAPSKEDKKSQSDSTYATGNKSADDLSTEMHNWVTGKDDWHDQIVNEYKEKISLNYEHHKQEQAERVSALEAVYEQESDQPVALVGYTPEQLSVLLKDRQPGAAGVRSVGAGVGFVREHLYSKYLERKADPGVLRPTEDGRLGIVSEGEQPSLNEQIANRQVPYGVDV